MGLQFGLEKSNLCFKRANRWLFRIDKICADDSTGANVLPPEKSSRPTISFKEMDVNHLIEDVFYPAKPEWKPITITLFDLHLRENPIFKWIQEIYDPEEGSFFEPNSKELIKECTLTMYDGCGEPIEKWIFEDCWPQNINFNTLDMGSSAIMMIELTLRFARAYISKDGITPPDQSPVTERPRFERGPF